MKNFLLKINRALVAKKKIFSLFFATVFTLSLSAQVYYLLPNSADANFESITNQYDHPSEGNRLKWETSDGDVYQCPERNAFDWFARTYCDASIPWICNEGDHQIRRIVTFKDLKDGRLAAESGDMFNDVKVIWVNVDRNMTESEFDALFPEAVRTALANYVKAGGNLYLSTFAARLAYLMERAPVQNNAAWSDGFCCDDKWKLTAHFIKDGEYNVDKHGHAIFKYLRDNDLYAGDYYFRMQNGSPRTNRNCLWDIDDNMTAFNDFQNNNTCGILGSWGHTAEFVCAGLVEFYPVGDWKGTIITNGLAACSFASTNSDMFCVEHLTRGILDYLKSTTPTLEWENTIPESGIINSQYRLTATTNDADHYIITYSAEKPEIANIGVGDGNVYFNYFGNATFHATIGGDGWNAPKNAPTITIDATIPVNGGDQAKEYAYVLPYSMHVMANYDNEDGKRPDFEAANWFYEHYIKTYNIGCFVRPSDLGSLNPAIKVLWIHNDHVGKESVDYYNDLGGDTFRDKLAAFLQNGGNVFVSKQATRLIGDLGRNDYPSYNNGGYANRGPWRVANKWNLSGTEIDHSTHSVYANMQTDTWIMAEGSHTDNNCIWQNFDGLPDKTDAGRITQYEEAHNCIILGAWGHYDNSNVVSPEFECVGMAEYYPQDNVTLHGTSTTFNQRGTIIAMGLGSYQWSNPVERLKDFTRDILFYLSIDETPRFNWDETLTPVDGSVGSEQIVHVEHKESEIHWTSSDENIVEIEDDPAHPDDPEYKKLVLKAAGTATITATRSGDGYKIPKNVKSPTFVTQTITVANGYTRNGLMQDYYYTVCLPKGAASYNGAQMFRIADKTENNDIVIEEVGTMEAGIPYIFLATGTQLNVIYNDGDISEAQSANGLIGYIGSGNKTLNPDGDKLYILADNQIWKVNQDVTVPSNRAYIDMSAINPTTPMPGRKRFVISSQNTATGIDGLNVSDSPKANKIIRNGQLLIKQGERIYNAQGQIVK